MYSLNRNENGRLLNEYFYAHHVCEELLVISFYKAEERLYMTQIISKLTNQVLTEYISLYKERAEYYQKKAVNQVIKMKKLEHASIQ